MISLSQASSHSMETGRVTGLLDKFGGIMSTTDSFSLSSEKSLKKQEESHLE